MMYNRNIYCNYIKEYIMTINISVIHESVFLIIHESVFLIIHKSVFLIIQDDV